MATLAQWAEGARPRTLPAAAAPVIVGSAAAYHAGEFSGWLALAALAVALSLQIGVNLANDYSDGIRGTDLERVGPMRLVASGAASPSAVKYAAFGWFGAGALFGLVLVIASAQWWLLAIGVAAIAAAWFYTGGKNPYGYRGLGEVGVFVFFGLVAVLGTQLTQAGRITLVGVLGAISIGLLACALLMVNNIRDIAGDRMAGKMTLAVRMGERNARLSYVAMIAVPILLGSLAAPATGGWSLLVCLLLAPAVLLSIPVLAGAWGRALIMVLSGTGLYELGFALLFAIALVLGAR
ncbi:1,4-dihydroxy-2-naphthoate polyprenyltransferase [Rarobacter incanus]|uniref:1,4-dihydroxy-2-naphthoate octaprenyltransferase n=1 Tax=Rarobacter incanus TaxID=153494 RepID=A0A542SQT1_9MICO|nr:1,4-dihydroxy-2-naphthoate polyprenyltransferase [Rarobacter incanus]TQK76962.1 1,4-dihydroxy-2-naphthoate prenyltransferase [Rarobacter incanus]